MTVVDLGAGPGFFVAETLRRVGSTGRLLLVDPDEDNLALAARLAGSDPRVEVTVASAAHLPEIPPASIDRALLSFVLCCVVDKEGVMDEAWRLLRPGGRVHVSYPSRATPRLRRRVSLRVGRDRWASLLARNPWRTISDWEGWLVTAHLLEKPTQ